jgi:exodeoxyribonuclease VII large subunit
METRPGQRKIYTVTEVSRRIKDLVEREFTDVWIEGEVSNLRRSGAGHIYFTLKDQSSQLSAVCFRNAAMYLRFKPENGESFRARGRLSTYEARGEYQIIVEVLEPVGRGALQEAFDRLKEKLNREGLFDTDRKRPLPRFPARVGVVTSAGSAALQDILSVLERRHDSIDILIYPTTVQGDRAAPQIAEGIDYLSGSNVDVVIVTRGGGSIEDLWPFNDERVALSIFRCEKPVISAVGHEIDFTISDFVADQRAPTPSAAAEMVIQSKREVLERLEAAESRITAALRYRLSESRRFLAARAGGRGFVVAEQRIRQLSQRVDDCVFRLEQFATSGRFFSSRANSLDRAEISVSTATRMKLQRSKQRFRALTEPLDALSPLAVLERGYAVCRMPDGAVVRSSGDVELGADIDVVVREGEIAARVTGLKKERSSPK